MRGTTIVMVCAALAIPATAEAFCGFYVEGSGASLYNNATRVVLMRDGTKTVLSMQNNYQGPTGDFAMVVPVPVVLQKENVKTLSRGVFDRIDQLAAPRLVEYWEQDPCMPPVYPTATGVARGGSGTGIGYGSGSGRSTVKIEAKFTVGEYQIVILSATESTGLEDWLHEQGYKIPKGAAAYLEPYVAGGSKFFVAKVDAKKVTFDDKGMAMLSPLRFHYDSPEFSLPIRLGLMNAPAGEGGKQDLIVHVLAKQRYELANYANAFIPTNLDLKKPSKDRFAEFYAALFDATLEKHPGAVVTEYAWDASSCDPCPTPGLRPAELMTFGGDVVGAASAGGRGGLARGWVVTRLHARYGAGDVKDDLVFRAAEPVMGGREVRSGPNGGLEEGARKARRNNFQARYAIRHEWTGPIECDKPVRGRWGGPPNGGGHKPVAARDLAFAPRGRAPLPTFVKSDIPELSVVAAAGAPPEPSALPPAPEPPPDKPAPAPETPKKSSKSKGCSAGADPGLPWGVVIWVGAVLMVGLRRRSR